MPIPQFSPPSSTLPSSFMELDPFELMTGGEPVRSPADPDSYFERADYLWEAAAKCHGSFAPYRAVRAQVVAHLSSLIWETYEDATGESVDEAQEIRDQGLMPVTHNRLKPLFRHLRGSARQNASDRTPFAVESSDQEAVSAIAEALREVKRRNLSRELDVDNIGELAMSGMAIRRTTEEWDDEEDRYEIEDDIVHSNRFFCDIAADDDRRLKRVSLMGEILDSHPDEVLQAFAEDEDMESAIRAMYDGDIAQLNPGDPSDDGVSHGAYELLFGDDAGHARYNSISFEMPEPGRWRIYRICRREATWKTWYYDAVTDERYTLQDVIEGLALLGQETDEEGAQAYLDELSDSYEMAGQPPIQSERRRERSWVVYHLSQTRHVLKREEDMYRHGKPPYTVLLHDFIDGEPRGIFQDLLGTHKQITRTFAQIDQMISAGAKGLWAVPEQALPKGMGKEEFAEQFSKVGNILFYDLEQLAKYPNAGNLIKAIQPTSVPASIIQHVQMMQDSLEKSSGFTDAMLGREPASGTPASLHHQMVIQGNTGSLDLFECAYSGFSEHDEKIVSNILQFWTDIRPVRSSASSEPAEFDPSLVEDLTWRVSMARMAETALYKQLFEQDLKDLLNANRVTLPQYLQESSHPRAQALLMLIMQSNPMLSGQATPDQLAQFVAMAEAGDMDALALLTQFQEFGGSSAGMPSPNTA